MTESIRAAIENCWPALRLLVVGDVMLDQYVWGQVARISPEAPVPVVLATRRTEQPGGAANVALNVARLGADCRIVGFTGSDENGRILAQRLQLNGVSPQFIESAAYPTVTKQRILGGRQQMLRIDTERLDPRPEADCDLLIEAALGSLPGRDAVILSDYAKGALPPRVCQAVLQAARRQGIPALVDPKYDDLSRYRGATAICPNRGELARALHLDPGDLTALLKAAEALVPALGLDFLAATLSEQGIALVRQGYHHIAPALARQVFDVSGAGDTVIAVLALCLASGMDPEIAAHLANVAAGIVVAQVGTVPVERQELLTALSPDPALPAQDKILTREQAAQRAAAWKANGLRVVLTNGCFDLLHAGHIALLEEAHRLGDRLIVAINTDHSVRGLKGPGRPIVAEPNRARVLAALAAVDAVVAFNEPTPLELIEALRPDVLVKGGDYTLDTVVGAREVQSWGGQVHIVPVVQGFSTTRLIEKGAAS